MLATPSSSATILRCLLMMASLFALTACVTVTEEGTPESTEVTFTNTDWKLQHVGGQSVDSDKYLQAPYVIFMDDGQVTGFSGCNSFMGRYGTVEGQFRFLSMASTRKACAEGTVELPFLTAMKLTVSIEIDDDELVLLNDKGEALAIFRASKSQ